MKLRAYYKNDRIEYGLDLTKKDLLYFLDKFNTIHLSSSVSRTINDNDADEDENTYVGTLFGSLGNYLKELDEYKDMVNHIDYFHLIEKNIESGDVINVEYEKIRALEDGLRFGEIIELLKKGYLGTRLSWNGNNLGGKFKLRMFIVYVPSSTVVVKPDSPYGNAGFGNKTTKIDAHIDLCTPKGTFQPGWLAAQPDMLAEDWLVIDPKTHEIIK